MSRPACVPRALDGEQQVFAFSPTPAQHRGANGAAGPVVQPPAGCGADGPVPSGSPALACRQLALPFAGPEPASLITKARPRRRAGGGSGSRRTLASAAALAQLVLPFALQAAQAAPVAVQAADQADQADQAAEAAEAALWAAATRVDAFTWRVGDRLIPAVCGGSGPPDAAVSERGPPVDNCSGGPPVILTYGQARTGAKERANQSVAEKSAFEKACGKAKAAAKRPGKPPASAPVACEPTKWVAIQCADNPAHGCHVVPHDLCGDRNCKTCEESVDRRRQRRLLERLEGATTGYAVLTYPPAIRDALTAETFGAMSAVAWHVVEAWLRDVQRLDPRYELAGEDWLHPEGDETPGAWRPHHNVVVRLQGLRLETADGATVLRRRDLDGHVSKWALGDLRRRWLAVLVDIFGEDSVPATVDVHWSYLRATALTSRECDALAAKRAHRAGYYARTFPGWFADEDDAPDAGRLRSQRRAYGYFHRGWPLYRQMLGLDKIKPRPATCGVCGSRFKLTLLDADAARTLARDHGLTVIGLTWRPDVPRPRQTRGP